MLENKYLQFYNDAKSMIDPQHVYLDDIRTLAYGTDAGFYRLIPKMVVRSQSEEEIANLLKLATQYSIPVTFRAAGTSLAGQSITDSVLIFAGKNWTNYSILDNGKRICLQPGIVGARVNELLAPFGTQIGPDPASINSAMIGGIVMNNASGMNCGTHANSYQTIESVKIVLTDGTILDTGSAQSRQAFKQTHASFLNEIERLRNQVMANSSLVAKIKHKYSIKNTTGYSINPFVDFTDPFDIITHLMVGSEGSLAFLSELTLRTIDKPTHRSTSMMYFNDIVSACEAVVQMKKGPTHSAEMLDRVALKSVENADGIPSFIKNLPKGATAILVETLGNSLEQIEQQKCEILELIQDIPTLFPIEFTEDPSIYSQYWNIRKGIFPAVGGLRETGTTCIIEDIAFHVEDLPKATLELQTMLKEHGYKDAVIYGHALEGNYHFIINQNFDNPEDVQQYVGLMKAVDEMVVDKYNGSLKAEHGTGRNMAPFVEHEWGEEAYALMQEIKELFDPNTILNQGVIINKDPNCFVKGFKELKPVDELVDKCIECGFCEVNCLTNGFSLSARMRIVVQREIKRLEATQEDAERLQQLKEDFVYLGERTCAGDGLCATSCPVGIDTGKYIKKLRAQNNAKPSAQKMSQYIANHFSMVTSGMRLGLNTVNVFHQIMGSTLLGGIASGVRKLSGGVVPAWTSAIPKGAPKPKQMPINQENPLKVVYFPSCIAQAMGVAKGSPYKEPLHQVTQKVLTKAGYEVIFPEKMSSLCCGTPWESKGLNQQADQKSAELEAALLKASENGKYPILCDTSPCLYRMRRVMDKRLNLYEPVEFIDLFLMDKLKFTPIDETIAVHSTCTTSKMGLKDTLKKVAEACAKKVILPAEIGCCGFAGDRGFNYPEVNQYALRKLHPVIKQNKVSTGYSNSRTCEIGLTHNSGVHYQSIMYLVDRVSTSLSDKSQYIQKVKKHQTYVI